MSDRPESSDQTIDSVTQLRLAGQPVAALASLVDLAVGTCKPQTRLAAAHFLGRPASSPQKPGVPCLLLEAARRSRDLNPDEDEFHLWIHSELKSPLDRVPSLIAMAPVDDDHSGTSVLRGLANLRCRLVRLSRSSSTPELIDGELRAIVEGYESAWGWLANASALIPSPAEPVWLSQLPSEDWRERFRQIASRSLAGWNCPSLHVVGLTLNYLWGRDLAPPSFIARTRVLLANTQRNDGEIGELFVEAIPDGSGVLFPHPLYAGYLATDAVFQTSLIHALQTLRRDSQELQHDFRWSLRVSDPSDPLDLAQALQVTGNSAGAAFYCAMRAAVGQELLDDQAAITAALPDPSIKHKSLTQATLYPVGAILDKLSGLRAERDPFLRHRITRILVSSNQLWRGDAVPADGLVEKINQSTVTLQPVTDPDAAYQSLTAHGRIARILKQAFAANAKSLLDELCRPYILPTLSKKEDVASSDEQYPLKDAKQEVLLSIEERDELLSGRIPDPKRTLKSDSARVWILADSGAGKSMLLTAAELSIANGHDMRVPIRLGAGPKSSQRVEETDRPISHNLLSDIQWDLPLGAVLDQILKAKIDEIPKELRHAQRQPELKLWLERAIQRGEIVFLLDAMDQTHHDIALNRFLPEIPECPVLVTGRPETTTTRRQSIRFVDWQFRQLKPLQLPGDIKTFCEGVPGLTKVLLGNKDWKELIVVPVLLEQMRFLYLDNKRLLNLKNRESVYYESLHRLLRQAQTGLLDADQTCIPGLDALLKQLANEDPDQIEARLAEYAWAIWKSGIAGQPDFSGVLRGAELAELEKTYPSARLEVVALNYATSGGYFDAARRPGNAIAWRHKSFGEWFAGLHLASLDVKKQHEFFELHARTPQFGWVIAFAMSAADRLEKPEVVERMARWLIEFGNPFHLRRTLDGQKLTVSPELNSLCNWLVHRDYEFREVVAERPEVDQQVAAILDTMFSLDEKTHLPKHRDSRWLHAAWELVRETAVERSGISPLISSYEESQSMGAGVESRTPSPPTPLPEGEGRKKEDLPPVAICQAIHDRFLGEFEARLNQYAPLRSDKDREDWRDKNRGLIQLVPEECREALGFKAPDLEAIRIWPAPSSSPLPPGEGPGVRVERPDDTQARSQRYAQRRDEFNQRLKDHHVNWCLCPPQGWEHPYELQPNQCRIGVKEPEGKWELKQEPDPHLLKPDYYLQRTPVTNIQFEALDPDHDSFRQLRSKQNEELKKADFDDHPVVEVTWFQAQMLAIWMTGKHQTFGKFVLPDEKDWESCCRAGRDAEGEISGVPWIDANGQEDFRVLTSKQANFHGNYPLPDSQTRPELKGEYIGGTVPVGQYRANGFGLVDMQGQVWEWQQTPWDDPDSPDESSEDNRTVGRVVRGGSWYDFAGGSRSSNRFRFSAEARDDGMGFRLSRTF